MDSKWTDGQTQDWQKRIEHLTILNRVSAMSSSCIRRAAEWTVASRQQQTTKSSSCKSNIDYIKPSPNENVRTQSPLLGSVTGRWNQQTNQSQQSPANHTERSLLASAEPCVSVSPANRHISCLLLNLWSQLEAQMKDSLLCLDCETSLVDLPSRTRDGPINVGACRVMSKYYSIPLGYADFSTFLVSHTHWFSWPVKIHCVWHCSVSGTWQTRQISILIQPVRIQHMRTQHYYHTLSPLWSTLSPLWSAYYAWEESKHHMHSRWEYKTNHCQAW